jgi:hypothetical protein
VVFIFSPEKNLSAIQTLFLSLGGIVVGLLGLINVTRNANETLKLMGLSVDFIIKNGRLTLTDILCILISNKGKKIRANPVNDIFRELKKWCAKNGNNRKTNEIYYQQRRIVAEALPGLYQLNRRNTRELIGELRMSFDGTTWGADNRRRTIEALLYLPHKEKKLISRMIQLQEKDSEYVFLAIIELLLLSGHYKQSRDKAIEGVVNDLRQKQFIYSDWNRIGDVFEFIDKMKNIVKGLSETEPNSRAQYLQSTFENADNLFIKVFISRNIHLACSENQRKICMRDSRCSEASNCGFPMLRLFDTCFAKSNEKNVRRPLAREQVCFCLLRLYYHQATQNDAAKRLLALIKDSDEIIPVTTFDYIFRVHEQGRAQEDMALYNKIVNYCKKPSAFPSLQEKAKHITSILPKK